MDGITRLMAAIVMPVTWTAMLVAGPMLPLFISITAAMPPDVAETLEALPGRPNEVIAFSACVLFVAVALAMRRPGPLLALTTTGLLAFAFFNAGLLRWHWRWLGAAFGGIHDPPLDDRLLAVLPVAALILLAFGDQVRRDARTLRDGGAVPAQVRRVQAAQWSVIAVVGMAGAALAIGAGYAIRRPPQVGQAWLADNAVLASVAVGLILVLSLVLALRRPA